MKDHTQRVKLYNAVIYGGIEHLIKKYFDKKPRRNSGMRVRADVSAVAVADIRNGGAMGGNAGRFIKVPKYGSFFAIKGVIMVAWEILPF